MSENNDAISSKATFFKQQAFKYDSDTAVGFGAGLHDKTTTLLYSVWLAIRCGEKKRYSEIATNFDRKWKLIAESMNANAFE